MNISIIMPALNEEKNIHEAVSNTLKAFEAYNIDGEVLVMNDGSTDNTLSIVEKIIAADSRVRVFTHPKPMGIGGSFWHGVDEAKNEVVSMFPGDNENDPYETLRYVSLIDHVDIIIPFVFNKETRSLFRNGLSQVYRFIINTTFLVNFNYTNGTVLYRKSVLKTLNYRNKDFFFQTDILVRAVKQGYLFAEVPYRLGVRSSGKSKAVSFPSFLRVARGYLKLMRHMHLRRSESKVKSYAEGSMTANRYTK